MPPIIRRLVRIVYSGSRAGSRLMGFLARLFNGAKVSCAPWEKAMKTPTISASATRSQTLNGARKTGCARRSTGSDTRRAPSVRRASYQGSR